MVFHWRRSDSKSPQVSTTLLSILAVFNNAVVWMVSNRPPTSKSSGPFNNPLVTVSKAPITIGIIFTFIFHSFFNSLARSRYLYLFSHSCSFILWSAGTAKSTILQIFFSFFFFLLIITRSDYLAEIRWSVCISKSHRIIIIIITPVEFFTSVIADGFSLEFGWQQLYSSLQDSSQYSGSPQQCCRFDSLHPSANFQVLQAL